jgi:hypothetical protein
VPLEGKDLEVKETERESIIPSSNGESGVPQEGKEIERESILPPSMVGPRVPLEGKETEREPSEPPVSTSGLKHCFVDSRGAAQPAIILTQEESDVVEDRKLPESLIKHKSEDKKDRDVLGDDDEEDDDSDYRRYVRRRRREKERRRWMRAEMRRKEKRRQARYARGEIDSDSDDDMSLYSETSLSWDDKCFHGPDMRCCGMTL